LLRENLEMWKIEAEDDQWANYVFPLRIISYHNL
jgi:hypothetical protein